MNATMTTHTKPALHNAMWPGLVGKGPDSEPPIDLDTMLDLTAAANVDGVRFDGVDLFLFDPHVDIDSIATTLKRLADRIRARGFVVGSLVAPVWPPTGGGSAMGSDEDRKRFLTQVKKGVRDWQDASRPRHPALRRRAHRLGGQPVPTGRRIRQATRSASRRPSEKRARLPKTTASGLRPKEKSAGAACTAGSACSSCSKWWIARARSDSRPTWRTRCSSRWAATRLRIASCPKATTGPIGHARPRDRDDDDALRPWTIDFHVAQNDATVKGSGSHDKTGRHCLPNDPNGKMDIVRVAGAWMRDDAGKPTRAFEHICWDGCMFPNATMMDPQTWRDVLATMIAVRNAHGTD